MFISIRPMAGEMPNRMPRGMASTILSRTLKMDSTMNTMPSIRMIISAAWKEAT